MRKVIMALVVAGLMALATSLTAVANETAVKLRAPVVPYDVVVTPCGGSSGMNTVTN